MLLRPNDTQSSTVIRLSSLLKPTLQFANILLMAATVAFGQQTFEVASIKPTASNDNRVMIRMQPGGRFTASGVTLKQLMSQAYNVREFQIANGPGWIGADRYDVNAKAEGAADRIPPEQLRPMLQAMLADRFELKVHTESKEMPAYALVVGKNGFKLSASKSPERPMMRMGRGQLNGTSIPMAMLAQQLSQQLGRRVIDETGLKESYDITLEWTPDSGHAEGPAGIPSSPDAVQAAGVSGPTIFTALQEQLGLRLESQKAQGDIIVIDHVSKPTEN